MSGSQLEIPSLPVSAERITPESALAPPRPGDPRDALNLPQQLTDGGGNKRRWLIALGVLGALALAYFELWAPRGPAALYRVSPVERRAIRQTVEAFGSLDVVKRVLAPAPRPGQLTEIYARRGTLVTAGQPLAKLDATGATADLSAAQTAMGASAAGVERARAARASASDERARAERLLERGLVSAASVTAARAGEAEASAALHAAEAQRDLDKQAANGARLRRDETTLRAPVSGFILSGTEDVGAMVGPQTGPLFVITPPLIDLVLTVPISEADIGLVRVAQTAVFSVSAYPDRRFPAQVDEIESEPQRSGSSVSYRVRLRVKNPDQVLLPGMTANVTLEIAEAGEALAVREAALRFVPPEAGAAGETPRSRVWRVTADGSVEPVEVVVGLSDGAYTAVTPAEGAELAVGEVVAVGYSGSGRDAKPRGGPGISLGSKP